MLRRGASLALTTSIMLLATTLQPSAQSNRIGREQTIHSSVASGQTVRVFGYVSFGRDCTGRQPPQIVMRTQPAHGTVAVQPGPSTARIIRNDAVDCSGQTYQGTIIYYTAQAGYHGPDQFDYSVVHSNSSDHDTAVIDVR